MRVHGTPPMFKLYIINDAQVFFGFTPSTSTRSALAMSPRPSSTSAARTPSSSATPPPTTTNPWAPSTSPRPPLVRQHLDHRWARGHPVTANTSERLARLMSGVELLMLDFDGPVCSVFAGVSAPSVADRLRHSLRGAEIELKPAVQEDNDPLSIYRHSATLGRAVIAQVHAELVAAEREAVASTLPTPGTEDLIRAARERGMLVDIVSNNAAEAVEAYLREHGLRESIDHVAARRTPEPDLMKPNTAYLTEAAAALGVELDRSALVGDSVTDMTAAQRAGVVAPGFANKPGKRRRLTTAGVDWLVDDLAALTSAVETSGGGAPRRADRALQVQEPPRIQSKETSSRDENKAS